MDTLQLPFVNLPRELTYLLKANISGANASGPIFESIRPNLALYSVLETAFKEFDDGRGLEKTMTALGWANFRDRLGSIYVFKKIYGAFPLQTDMSLVDDIKQLENRFSHHSVHGPSRLFLLGLYIKFANMTLKNKSPGNSEFVIPDEMEKLLKLSQGRSEKIDWLILIILHLYHFLGEKMLTNALLTGKKFKELYFLIPNENRMEMFQNLLAYGASINEADIFYTDNV